ncbi:MAG: methylglyoxal synthase [Oscillospiraceae bacterium]|jgi:methylglyoxal synthase|nr:methylglyoxal synthase [Oscillospiraceae bacterium]
MNIALIAHETKKELMMQFCIAYCGVLSKHYICALEPVSKEISDLTGLCVEGFLSYEDGGDQQILSKISCQEVDLLLFFRDGLNLKFGKPLDGDILRLCDTHNIPIATNTATAEVLIRGLKRGDLDWRAS